MLPSLRHSASPRSSCSSFAIGFRPGKIFDEVYFARAAEEYLQRRYIYENTHPPVTKLLITLSVILFGGLPHGDTSYGWRFFNVVAGAIAVLICFLLAKRITRSTLFGAYAAVLFGLDGMHYAQSRIATPEAFVVCFSMLTLYAFCRYWDAVAEAPTTARASFVERAHGGVLRQPWRSRRSSSSCAFTTRRSRRASCCSSSSPRVSMLRIGCGASGRRARRGSSPSRLPARCWSRANGMA